MKAQFILCGLLAALSAHGQVIRAPGGGAPGGAAGGDLGGNYPNPSVVSLNGQSLAALATGILKVTTGTGVPSIAGSADILAACTTCVTSSAPGAGIAHFAGSTQAVTSSAIVAADIAANTITGSQLAASLALVSPLLGTPTSGVLTNATGLPFSSLVSATNSAAAMVLGTGASLAFTGTSTLDLSADTGATAFKVPVIAGATAGADGVIDYDSTNKNTHVRTNGADSIVGAFAAAPVTGDVVTATIATGNTLLSDSGILGTNIVRKDAANIAAAAMTLNLSGETTVSGFRVPVIAGATSTFDGTINYDSTGTSTHVRTDGGDGAVPAVVKVIDLTGQTAAIATSTALYTPTTSRMFRVSYYAKVTTAATTSSILGGTTGLQVLYTDGTDSVAQNVTMPEDNQAGNALSIGTGNTGNSTTSVVYGVGMVYGKTAVAMTYGFGYTSVGATPMQYELHIKVEAM